MIVLWCTFIILNPCVWHQLVPHITTHNTDSPLPHPTLPLHPSPMSSTPSKSSGKSSINLIGPNKELPDFAYIARGIQNWASRPVGSESTEAQLVHEFFGMSVRVVKILWQLDVCNKLQPRRGATQSTCSGCYTSSRYTPSRALVARLSAHLLAPLTKRPIANGSEPTPRPLPSWLMLWWVYSQCEDGTCCCIFCDESLWFIWQYLYWQVLGNLKKMGSKNYISFAIPVLIIVLNHWWYHNKELEL